MTVTADDTTAARPIQVRRLGLVDYTTTWHRMRQFTDQRCPRTDDELWLLEHPPVFTQGQAGRDEHLLDPGVIPVVRSDRGGQITYHGPGQLILYTLIDLRRVGIGIRAWVSLLEQLVIAMLAEEGVDAVARSDAPGVYVNGRKIAALGLRVRRGCTYHGLSLNVDGDLAPFHRINPCGYRGLEVTSMAELGISTDIEDAGHRLTNRLIARLSQIAREN